MGRKKKFIPDDCESLKGEGDTSANIFKSMLLCDAWKAAPSRAKTLYLTMKCMMYGSPRHDKDDFDEAYRRDNRYFTFNEAKWIKGNKSGFELYSDKKSFYKDVAILIELGFIDCVDNGCNTRTKNLYRFSTRWRVWGTNKFTVPESCKTEAMRGTKKKSRNERAEQMRKVKEDANRKEKLGI